MKKLLLTASVLTPLGLTSPTLGQTVNYNDLQELFGEPVTTSATGKPQRQSEAPASMIIITGDEARRTGARTIPDVLQNYAGIDMNRYTTAQREVTVRGGNMPLSPRLLVLVNGRQVYLDHYGYTDWSLIGVEMIDIQQIEVVKGPNSALFGFNAAAGVVNIITVDPLALGSQFKASAELGSHGLVSLSGTGSVKMGDNTALKLTAGYHEEDNWSGIVPQSGKPNSADISGEITSQIADNVRATFSYNYSEAKQQAQAYGYDLYAFDSTLKGMNAVVAADTGMGLIKFQAFYNSLNQDVSIVPGYSQKNDILSVKLEDLLKIGSDHSFRLAVEYRRNEFERKDSQAGKVYYDVYAASGMWEWLATDKLTLTTAARVDRLNLGHGPINTELFPRTVEDYDKSYTELSYNASLIYAIDDLTKVRLGAARGIQAPSLIALGVAIPEIPGLLIVGNPNLEPSVSTSYEVAFDRAIPALNGAFNLTGSYTDVKDFLAASQSLPLDPITGGMFNGLRVLTDDKLGNFKTYAIEASLSGRIMQDKLGWQVNYTWTDVKETFLNDTLETNVTLEEGTPTHKANVKFDYVDGPWSGFLVGRFRSDTIQRKIASTAGAEPFLKLDSAVTVDARVAYTFESGLSFWVSGENLTSNSAAGLSVYKADSRFLMGVKYGF